MERQERALYVRIPAELYRKIAVYCAENDQTIKQFVINALEYDLWRIEVEKLMEEKEGGELSTGKEQQSGSTPPKERALRFANDEAFLKAVTHLWRKQPFELGGWHCLIVSDSVANDLLGNFNQEEVKEIELVNLADLPEKEALRRYAARFKK
jgi:hypothetical protein